MLNLIAVFIIFVLVMGVIVGILCIGRGRK